MRDWVRWLLVGLGLVLVLAMVVYARGERQRGDVQSEASADVIPIAAEGRIRLALVDGVSWS